MPRRSTRPAATVTFPRLAAFADPPAIPRAPVEQGRLWYDHQIADQFFGGLPRIGNKVRWIREHLPRATRIQIGRDSAWYERDILAYIATLQSKSTAG